MAETINVPRLRRLPILMQAFFRLVTDSRLRSHTYEKQTAGPRERPGRCELFQPKL
jgi:hypothetical protein